MALEGLSQSIRLKVEVALAGAGAHTEREIVPSSIKPLAPRTRRLWPLEMTMFIPLSLAQSQRDDQLPLEPPPSPHHLESADLPDRLDESLIASSRVAFSASS
jgi:hypothetical protein